MPKKKKIKKNVQRVIHDPEKGIQWDVASNNPFINPIFYILLVICLPFWYFDEAAKHGYSWTAFGETIWIAISSPITFFVVASILKFLFAAGSEVSESYEKKELDKAKKRKEEKYVEEQTGPRMTGTAFFIDQKGHLITNFHVIDNCGDKLRAMCDREEKKCRVIAIDKSLDLALLKVNYRNENYVQIDDKTLSKMQPIIAAGYPALHLSDDLKLTSGIISSLKGFNNNSALIQIDAALNSGNSGGPIIDKEDGNLAAVAVARMEGSHYQSINYGIKSSRVKEFIESNNIKLPKKKKRTKKIKRKEIADNLENTTVLVFH